MEKSKDCWMRDGSKKNTISLWKTSYFVTDIRVIVTNLLNQAVESEN